MCQTWLERGSSASHDPATMTFESASNVVAQPAPGYCMFCWCLLMLTHSFCGHLPCTVMLCPPAVVQSQALEIVQIGSTASHFFWLRRLIMVGTTCCRHSRSLCIASGEVKHHSQGTKAAQCWTGDASRDARMPSLTACGPHLARRRHTIALSISSMFHICYK